MTKRLYLQILKSVVGRSIFFYFPGFCILLRETFPHSIAFPLINKYAKGAVVQIWTVFVPIYHVAFPMVFRNETF